MDKSSVYAIIMAGGKGERFWPQSRASHPKQLLRLIGNLTLIEQTVERLKPMVKAENILIITNQDYVAPMHSLLNDLPPENIIGEPMGRDTAPCVALATALVKARNPDDKAVMMLLPADHVIKDTENMLRVFRDSAELAREGKIITIGVNPSFPSTGYGYIHCGEKLETACSTSFYTGLGFTEKPDSSTAKEFIAAGCYKWNSGMFLWSVETIYNAFAKFCPELANSVKTLTQTALTEGFAESLRNEYEKLEKISIDYAVMEKVDNVVVAECIFDWDDVGSWMALRNQIRPSGNNNVVSGLHVGIDTNDSIIVGDTTHLIATIDIEDLIIVHTPDATLVCQSKSAQRVKEIVRQIATRQELGKFL